MSDRDDVTERRTEGESRERSADQGLRLRTLAAAHCDDALSDEESAELESLLAASAEARSAFVRYMNLHATLDWEITSSESVADLTPYEAPVQPRAPATAAAQPSRTSEPENRRRMWLMTVAATVTLVATALIALQQGRLTVGDPRGSGYETRVAIAEAPAGKPVATVTELGPNAQWAVTPRPGASPRELRETDVIAVTEGQIQVMFDCGAVVTLYAPAMLEAVSPMTGRAIRGRLAATVNEGAQGFTIETPRATVVDLGTVFGVEVGDEGATDVVVFKGAVDLHFDGRQGATGNDAPQRLTSGEAMRIDKRGTTSRIVSIFSDRFSSDSERAAAEKANPPLISAVTDNIARDSGTWNYYEIVPGGMREDAKAFVDRIAHEWNGLDERGIPQFLVGGDYVKTFNNDKYTRGLEVFVTVDRPCRLFVLLDDRVPTPSWLSERFVDTGEDIGLDVGPFLRVEDGVLVEDRQPGVGPGQLVDDVASVWEMKVDEPQVVHLGATASHRYINMYGVVATPLTPERDSDPPEQ